MINRTEAERIACAVHDIRPDWPLPSIMTLIEKDLSTWPWLDLLVGLIYVAGDRNLDGTWVSRTPARVKEQGPWRTIGIADATAEASRQRAIAEVARRKEDTRTRLQAVRNCHWCDDRGRLADDQMCLHDNPTERARLAAERSAAARAAIRPTIRYDQEPA